MAVKVSGTVLSSLFFDHCNSDRDQEGFLLGQVHSHVTDTISDSQINNVKEETITYIYSHVPCHGGLYSWYDNSGNIVVNKIRALLNNNKNKEVIGWYKFRRNSTAMVSMREKAIHKKLRDAFPTVNNLLFMLCTATTNTHKSLHSFDHVLLTSKGSSFEAMPLHVVNLGDTAQSQYKMHPSNTVNSKKGIFAQAVHRFTSEFMDGTGAMKSVDGVRAFNSHVHRQLLDLCSTVVVSERQLGELSLQVQSLQQQIKARQDKLRPPALPHPPINPQPRPQPQNQPITEQKSKTAPAPSQPPKNLIDLDELLDVKSNAPVLQGTPVLEPVKVAQALVQSSRMAANLGQNSPPVTQSASNPRASKVPLMPQKSSLEPQLSKARHTTTERSQSSERKASSKPPGTFDFIDDFVHKEKTKLQTTKKGPKSVASSKSVEDQLQDIKVTAVRSNSEPFDDRIGSRSRTDGMSRSEKVADDISFSPSTNFEADENSAMEYEVSDSPTF